MKTKYDREPAGAWEPSPPPLPSFEILLLRLIQETIDLGVPPRRAAKWWLIIFEKIKPGEIICVENWGGLYLLKKTGCRGR